MSPAGAPPGSRTPPRDSQVTRVILIEGVTNVAVLALKLLVGISTGSLAVLGDAVHSLTDVANNVVAWFVVRMSAEPPDQRHPYGHRKFETLAVFGLATLLTVLAVELTLGAFRRESNPTIGEPWALPLMITVLIVNTALAAWEGRWARKLGSDILNADARHTLADVLTSIAVIIGWQVSARGYPWLDSLCALGVAALVLFLALGLFRRAIPVLVDRVAIPPEAIAEVALGIDGVRGVRNVRSRSKGAADAIDMVVLVDAGMTTLASHEIADAVERQLRECFAIDDATIHVEPDST
ncbi:MAG: cation diffusion facilitator family transporter [Polyangiales bacterium]